jgi:hypothetical protein
MRQWWEQGRVPPVLLLTGATGTGKRELAHFLAQWLLCTQTGFAGAEPPSAFEARELDLGLFGAPSSSGQASARDARPSAEASRRFVAEPCGTCAPCRRALQGAWIDFTEIAPESSAPGASDDGSSGTIKIEQLRDLKASLGHGAFEGAFKITLLRSAERMTPQAANSLLKILEEPPSGWLFLMTAADPTLILPTLLSRSQTIRLKPLSDSVLEALWDELEASLAVPRERRATSIALAQGSWSRLKTWAQPEPWEGRELVLRFLEEPGAALGPLVDWAAQEPHRFDLLLEQLERFCAELVLRGVGATSSSGSAASLAGKTGGDPASEKALRAHAARVTRRLGSAQAARAHWIEHARRLFRARIEAMAPLNRKVLIQDLLAPLA